MRQNEAPRISRGFRELAFSLIFLPLLAFMAWAGSSTPSSCSPDNWKSGADIPIPPGPGPVVAAINGLVYVAGGGPAGSFIANLQAYNPSGNTWTSLAPMPMAVAGAVGGVINSQLYVAGGYTSETVLTNKLFRYDPPSNTWTTLANMPNTSACGIGGVINGKLYVTVACDAPHQRNYLNYLYMYDPATNTWSAMASSGSAHWQPGGGVINGLLYVAGGGIRSLDIHSVEAYDPATNSWAKRAGIPDALTVPASAVIGGKLYVFGGNPNVGGIGYVTTIQVYDPIRNKWDISSSTVPAALGFAGADVVYGIAVLVGGQSNTGPPSPVTNLFFEYPSIP